MASINVLQPPTTPSPQPTQPVVQSIDPKTIPAGTIRPRQLQAGYVMVKVGLAADRPTTTNEIVLYFATDTLIMSYYDIVTETWKSGGAFS